MPIYDYICPSCGHQAKDRLVKRSEADSQVCPACGADEPMSRQISLPARGIIAGGGAADLAGTDGRKPSSGSQLGNIPYAGPDGSLYQNGRKITNPDGSAA